MSGRSSISAGRPRSPRSLVRVLELWPDLLGDLPAEEAAVAVRAGVAAAEALPRGAWSATTQGHGTRHAWMGLLVLDGLFARRVTIGPTDSHDLVGPGDLVRPWEDDLAIGSLPAHAEWTVLEPARVAVLDARFSFAMRRWPTVACGLLARATRRTDGVSALLAIAQVRRADTRLLLLLWHLADRWGRVGPEGVTVPLRVTQESLGRLVCLRRPTVSMALGRLRDAGDVVALGSGGWLLRGDPPDVGSLRYPHGLHAA